MASLPFADTDQLASWVGEEISSSSDVARAEAMLTAASVLVRAEVGAAVADAWDLVPEDVEIIVVQAAARVWFNPQGLIGDSIDDYSRRWESDGTQVGAYLTQAEKDILSAYRTKPKGLWTLGVTRDDPYDDQYLDVVNASDGHSQEPMPFLPPSE